MWFRKTLQASAAAAVVAAADEVETRAGVAMETAAHVVADVLEPVRQELDDASFRLMIGMVFLGAAILSAAIVATR